MLRGRRGWSLPELLVALVLLGIIGAATTSTLVQQGRVRTRIAWRLAAEAQMREAVAPLLADLGAASPAAADFDLAQATDTSIALRIAISEGFICGIDPLDSMTARVRLLSPMRGRDIAAGDSVWSYRAGRWTAAPVTGVSADAGAGACASSVNAARTQMRIALGGTTAPARGAAVRFTRRVRYSLYRAGDGQTYLGLREWSPALGTFAGQQPIAGPLSRGGSRFRYVDSLGNSTTGSAMAAARLAQVSLELDAPRYPWGHLAGPAPELRMVAALRNRR